MTDILSIKVKGPALVTAALVAILQAMFFATTWDGMLDLAARSERYQQGGVAFGLTIQLAFLFFISLSLIASFISAWTRSSRKRWLTILGTFVIWGSSLFPALGSYPYRGGALLALGALTLVIGSGVLVPVLNRYLAQAMQRSRPQ